MSRKLCLTSAHQAGEGLKRRVGRCLEVRRQPLQVAAHLL